MSFKGLNTCNNKSLHYKEFGNSLPMFYQKWQAICNPIYSPPKNENNTNASKVCKKHTKNIVHLYSASKTKKETVIENDAIIHVNFGENYQTKYAEVET